MILYVLGIQLLPGYYMRVEYEVSLSPAQVMLHGARFESLGIEYAAYGPEQEWEFWVGEYEAQSDWFGEDASWVLDEGIEFLMWLHRGRFEEFDSESPERESCT